jgi:hypothetical protein
MWFWHAQVWFLLETCDIGTHECDFHMQSVTLARKIVISTQSTHKCETRTIMIFTYKVQFPQAECDFGKHECNFHMHSDFNTQETELYTQSVITIRISVIFIRISVITTSTISIRIAWFWYAWVWFPHVKCDCNMQESDLYTQGVTTTRTSVISSYRV